MGVLGSGRIRAGVAVLVFGVLMWWSRPYLTHELATAILDLKAPAVGRKATDFRLPDANGKPHKLSEFKGKVVLLNFWATWCAPCAKEVPWFVEFQQEFRQRGFTVLGVSMDEQTDDNIWGTIENWASQRKVNYPLFLGDSVVTQAYGGVESLPTSLLVDRTGVIRQIHIGLVTKETWHQEIAEVVGPDTARP